jgi:hypothetical protein
MTDFGDDSSSRAVSLLRDAARELLPVIVDMGPDQAKYSSFVSLISGAGGVRAVLDPIAAEAMPEGARFVRIVPAAGPMDWSVTATGVWRDGSTRAFVDLSRARAERSSVDDHGSVAVQPTDLLVLVVPGGLNDATYVFPVQRIGSEICEIRCTAPLAVGTDLQCVELVGDRRLLRRASAQVLEVVPWYLADGSQTFSCRLSLGEEPAENAETHDLVTDAAQVRRLLQQAAAMRVQGWFEAPGYARGRLSWLDVGKDFAVLELSRPLLAPLPSARSIRIGMELFAIAYELDVRPLETESDRLRTSLPLILRRRRRHRRDQRVPVDPSVRVELGFRNPVTGAIQIQHVSEVSFFALSFEFDPSCVLWRGLPLEQAQLSWDRHLVHLGDLVVEQCSHDSVSGRTVCVASISNSGVADDPDMISIMASLAHPQVRAHDGADFAALHQTYLKAGLFGPHMHRNLDPIVEQTKTVWRKAHTAAGDVVRTFVHGPVDAPDAAVTVMRAWEHAWVAQHFVDTSPDLNSGTGKLQTALLDHLVPRPDGRYLLFFVKTDNQIMNSYFRRFVATTGTPDAVTRTTVELWSRKVTTQPAPGAGVATSVRRCDPADELIVARAAQRHLGMHSAAALSMLPGELGLPDTQRRFAKAGLDRDRICDLVLVDGEPVYAIVEERSTPGMNLTWMLNACWILPIHPELDPQGAGLDHALRAVVERPSQTSTGDRFLNLPLGIDPEQLAAWGFGKEASVYLYVLTRAGLHRCFHYAATRYGELDALAARRDRRRASRA